MPDPDAVSLTMLEGLDRQAFLALLGNVFEHAPWAAEAAWSRLPLPTVSDVFAAMRDAVHAASADDRMALVRAHPDLAGKAARAGVLTAESAREQEGVGLDRLTDGEFATFHRLNDAYQARFGHPFIICVRRHTKVSILAQFERRLANPADVELATAVAEIDRIAALRLAARLSGPGPLAVAGRLTTHVLDAERGRPASGVAIELREFDGGDYRRTIWRGVTDADGRTAAPLIEGRPIPIGWYELDFAIGPYFAVCGSTLADPPFLDRVPIRFAVAEPEGHYHVPLLATPWSYTTYRGS
jgi:2-oxo-4-hydroxy-4-carboxy-5-ureidoimidazoline decarboxylase